MRLPPSIDQYIHSVVTDDAAYLAVAARCADALRPETLEGLQGRVGFPVTRRNRQGGWDMDSFQAQLVYDDGIEPVAARGIALALQDLLEVLAVNSLTDISQLAPELGERVARRHLTTPAAHPEPCPTDPIDHTTKGKTMAQIIVELTRTGDTATRTNIRGHSLVMDRPESKGGSDAGPMGGEALLASVGGCFMSTLIAAAAARSMPVDGAICTVTGTLVESPSRFSTIDLSVRCDACPPADLEHLVAVADRGCLVAATLRNGPVVTASTAQVAVDG